MELNISTLQQNVTVTPALNMSCTNTPFTAPFKTEKQPGNFTIKVSYNQVNFLKATLGLENVEFSLTGTYHQSGVLRKRKTPTFSQKWLVRLVHFLERIQPLT